MKKRLIIGLLSVSVIAVMVVLLQKRQNVSLAHTLTSCAPSGTLHYRIPSPNGVEKHACGGSSTGSGIFDWTIFGISRRAIRAGLGLQVQYFGTEGVDCSAPVVAADGTVTFDPDCLINGQLFCCNGGGQCGGEGRPFQSGTQSAQAVLQSASCDSTGKCRETLILDLDPDEIQLVCQNRNWGGTFTPEEMYVQSCTCDTGFDSNGQCSGIPSCDVQHCFLDLTLAGYRPGRHIPYDCSLPVP